MSALDLTNTRAVVTGGSRGIGAAVSTELAAAGAHVFVNYRSDDASARRVESSIRGHGGAATLVKANVLDPSEITRLFQRLDGGLDILVHCAAIGSFKPLLDVRANQWDLTLM